ncbi:unnamed protein product [Urochloa decumbens]|uniref:F-box domain-containing protein n=1 Tax=Urochloa decumbens TaxID=240449 RepID=A0ABC9C1B6_9POAL
MAGGAKKKKVARGSKKKKKKGAARDAVSELTDDVLADILSRVPIKSLCHCKLVCRRWRDLISHPEHRKKLPQTLAGFFYDSYDNARFPKWARHFINVSGAAEALIDPSLSFLPRYERIAIVDCCNGLLLCRGWKPTDPVTMDYVVCNPGTKEWVVVPDSGWSRQTGNVMARLGFDPAVSSHFHVFAFIPDFVWHVHDEEMDENGFDGRIEVVGIYSSKTGLWSFNEDNYKLGDQFAMPMDSKGVFFNGVLHLTTFYGMVVAIDVEGNILRCIPVPILNYEDGEVYLSQGHLYFAARCVSDESDGHELSVWVLEDYDSENWSLKHNVSPQHMFGKTLLFKVWRLFQCYIDPPRSRYNFHRLLSYEMGHMRLRLISRLGCHLLNDFLSYVPLFSVSLAHEH